MHQNAELITRFYTAFGRLDYKTMRACYHADAEFSDPVFPKLRGKEIGLMWQMLCAKAKDFSLTFSDVTADDARGSANWVAKYRYSGSGRVVTNQIHADFEFRDGLIIRHRDTFNLHRWLGMALGPMGTFLGWLPPMQAKVRASAAAALAKFSDANAAGS
jgi:ketosteroid isomerase-like protein